MEIIINNKKYNIDDTIQFVESELNEFPEEIKYLKNIKKIIITNSNLPQIPSWFFSLISLEILEFSNCQLEIIHDDICNLTNLRELNLSYNKFKYFPENIDNLTNLKKLDIRYNQINSIPNKLYKLIPYNLIQIEFDVDNLEDENYVVGQFFYNFIKKNDKILTYHDKINEAIEYYVRFYLFYESSCLKPTMPIYKWY